MASKQKVAAFLDSSERFCTLFERISKSGALEKTSLQYACRILRYFIIMSAAIANELDDTELEKMIVALNSYTANSFTSEKLSDYYKAHSNIWHSGIALFYQNYNSNIKKLESLSKSYKTMKVQSNGLIDKSIIDTESDKENITPNNRETPDDSTTPHSEHKTNSDDNISAEVDKTTYLEAMADLANTKERELLSKDILKYKWGSRCLLGGAIAWAAIMIIALLYYFKCDNLLLSKTTLNIWGLTFKYEPSTYIFYYQVGSKIAILAICFIFLALLIRLYKSKVHLVTVLEHDTRTLGLIDILSRQAGTKRDEIAVKLADIIGNRPDTGVFNSKGGPEVSVTSHPLLRD